MKKYIWAIVGLMMSTSAFAIPMTEISEADFNALPGDVVEASDVVWGQGSATFSFTGEFSAFGLETFSFFGDGATVTASFLDNPLNFDGGIFAMDDFYAEFLSPVVDPFIEVTYNGGWVHGTTVELVGVTSDNGGGSTAVPEPSTFAMMGLGLLGIGFGARRKKAVDDTA